jgi:protease PrsW
MAPPRPDPERELRSVGAAVYGSLMLAGAGSLAFFFLVLPLSSPDATAQYRSMAIGALCAIPPLAVYLWVPRLLDRYDPEPWWALALVLGWGAVGACGIAAAVNTVVQTLGTLADGPAFGRVAATCLSAPIVEEAAKGLGVFGVFYYLRREFDGLVDGVIYATFAALGFAAVENIIYYGAAARSDPGGGELAAAFLVRGVLAPWGHPLYTSMTGIGFGMARETSDRRMRWIAPLGGYCAAVTLHCIWNTAATISGFLTILMLPLWLFFVLGFVGIVVWLVVRKGRIIRRYLEDEVMMGNLTRQELELVCSPFASLQASVVWGGKPGRRFVKAAARLALSKWHTRRAIRGRVRTVSEAWIAPLRQELKELRGEMARAMGRALPAPAPEWAARKPADPRQPRERREGPAGRGRR